MKIPQASTLRQIHRIVSWNVNGIRAVAGKGLMQFIEGVEPSILCLQETKAFRDQVEPHLQSLGYLNAFWSSAERKGYSGVATFTDFEPIEVVEHFGEALYQKEGRILRTRFPQYSLYNIYFPNGGSGLERHEFKQLFLKRLSDHLRAELAKGEKLIVVGDYNVAHREVDVHDPVRLSKESGFLPEERQWFEEFLALGMLDTFRLFHADEKDRYSWWSYRELARSRNKGWRIDYICVSENLRSNLTSADILDQVEGSDHCPVICELEFDSVD